MTLHTGSCAWPGIDAYIHPQILLKANCIAPFQIFSIKMTQDIFVDSLSKFFYSCNPHILSEEVLHNMLHSGGFSTDTIPLALLGLVYDFTYNYPQGYWNRDVANEVYSNILQLKSDDDSKLVNVFLTTLESLFTAISAYDSVLKLYSELNDVNYENGLKTRVFRSPIYTQICENCLMNLYRFIRDILGAYATKDYAPQNTLGKIIDLLRSKGFHLAVDIDVNLRNAINHGDTYPNDHILLFKYSSGGVYTSKEISIWEYDELIHKSLDIAGGIIMGIFRLFVVHPEFFNAVLAGTTEKRSSQEWLKLLFRSNNLRIAFFQENILGSPQLRVSVDAQVISKELLLTALIQIAKVVYAILPNYDRYMILYQHPRSLPGYIRLNREDIERSIRTGNDVDMILLDGKASEVIIWDIQTDKIDERAYRFHLFPRLHGDRWSVVDISDISITEAKRIKAQLLVEKSCKPQEIFLIVEEVISQLKNLYTPQNPKQDVPFGDREADAVFLTVHYKDQTRKLFGLLNNPDFVCIANYYKNDSVPKLKNGSLTDKLWDGMKKSNYRGLEIIGNPIYF